MSRLIIIRGPLGSGKSTISKKIADRLNATYISIDAIVDDPQLITKEKEEGYRSQKNFFQANDIVVSRIKQLLIDGGDVVIDGNFYWESAIHDLISKLKFPNLVFTLKVPLDVCIERDSKRETPHGEMAATVVFAKTTEFDYGINIDATQPIENSVNEILKEINKL